MNRQIIQAVEKLEQLPAVQKGRAAAFVQERMADTADRLSRRGLVAAQVLRCNESLHRLVTLCYEEDHGKLCNVDPVSGRLRIAAPFGSSGWRFYGLRRAEARTMRRILAVRLAAWQPTQRPPLFVFDDQRWAVNLFDYGTLETAQWWLQRSQISVTEWLATCQ